MIKKIFLKLKSIEYSGSSIGDDIRLEISILGKPFSIKKKIKIGTKQEFDEMIGGFDTDRKTFEAGIDIRVIEDDPVFNDVGNLETQIKIDTDKNQQEFVYEIKIKELRAWATEAVALFTVVLVAEAFSVVRYIKLTEDGWVVGKRLDNTKIDLPAFLKVNFDYEKSKRVYVTVLEGINRGVKVSLPVKSDEAYYLLEGYPYTKLAELTYSKSSKILSINGKKFKTTDDNTMPWDKGVYDVEIPDWSHKLGQPYKIKAKYATTWFRVGHTGKRYIHTGRVSKGCITLTEQEYFDDLYQVLITARRGDGQSVGMLTVVD